MSIHEETSRAVDAFSHLQPEDVQGILDGETEQTDPIKTEELLGFTDYFSSKLQSDTRNAVTPQGIITEAALALSELNQGRDAETGQSLEGPAVGLSDDKQERLLLLLPRIVTIKSTVSQPFAGQLANLTRGNMN